MAQSREFGLSKINSPVLTIFVSKAMSGQPFGDSPIPSRRRRTCYKIKDCGEEHPVS